MLATKPGLARAGLQALRAALARKTRLRDWQMLALYWGMEIWTSILSLANPHSYLHSLFLGADSSVASMLCFCFFFIASNALYLYIWLADPGYVVVSLDKELSVSPERSSAPSASDIISDKPSASTETAGLLKRSSVPAPQQLTIDVDNQQPSTPASSSNDDSNYCYLCDHTIPPRANHCRHCDRCVAKFDHHCPFLNNCVGARTHCAFTAFCFCQSVVMAYALFSSIAMIDFFSDSSDTLMNCIYMITAMGCGFLLMTSGFLCIGHVALTVRNKTTWEYIVSMRIRQQKWSGHAVRYAPPGNYDQGVWVNITEDCSAVPRPEYLFATRRVRHNAAWDGTDDVEIDTFDAELDSIQPLTVHGLSGE